MKSDFRNLGLTNDLCMALDKQRIFVPTPVQEQAIPHIIAGVDVIAQAQTGTGKTLAFLLPIFDKHNENCTTVEALVVTPTRELAIQIAAEARKLAQFKYMNILEAYGGKDIQQQIRKLKGNVHLIIGTPGRILDHMRRGTISLSHLKTFVLDEADQMLHIGFQQEIKMILKQTPEHRQTLCFSATMPSGVRTLASRSMKSPVTVSVQTGTVTLANIHQQVIETTDREKQGALFKVLDETNPYMAIIFCRTRRRVSQLLMAMHQKGYKCEELHGELTQNKRERAMKAFRNAEYQYLIATDVAARGLDIEGLSHIYSFDIADDAESYIHRMGRTGRAGQEGHSVTFVTDKDRDLLKEIEREISMTLPKTNMRLKEHYKEHHNAETDRRPESKGSRGPVFNARSGKANSRPDRNNRKKQSDAGDKGGTPGRNDRFDKRSQGSSERGGARKPSGRGR